MFNIPSYCLFIDRNIYPIIISIHFSLKHYFALLRNLNLGLHQKALFSIIKGHTYFSASINFEILTKRCENGY